MNLQNTASSREETSTKQPWYLQPETTAESTVQDATAKKQEAQALSSRSQTITRFEPSAAERILARAGALQEVHGQMLSKEQIEAIASEIGIRPEFVSLAIEQEGSGGAAEALTTVSTKDLTRKDRLARLQVATTTAAYGAFTTVVMAMFWNIQNTEFGDQVSDQIIPLTLFYLPALVALCLGTVGRGRRSGTFSGAALAMVVIFAATFGSYLAGHTNGILPEYTPVFSLMIATGALLGLAGAQGRRVVSRRRARRAQNPT